MHRLALAACLVVACGRVGFDPLAGGAGIGDGAGPPGEGGALCAAAPICGDGCCAGGAGELCTTCTADCATREAVCGNGACDPGEDGASCLADCGPAPWPWTGDEATLRGKLDALRTTGTNCPDSGMLPATGTLAPDDAMLAEAREWAWEMAHQQYLGPDAACNGRTLADRIERFAPSAAWLAYGSPLDEAGAVAVWQSDANACTSVMQASFTRVGAAVAHDALPNVYVIILR